MDRLDPAIAALVLLSAVLHASWNGLTKASGDRLLSFSTIMLVTAGFGGVGAVVYGFPDRAAWPFLAASVVAHTVYAFSLLRMYRFGDLSQTYPVARGLAPLLVGVFSSLFADEIPRPLQALGLVVAASSIASLAFAGGRIRGDTRRALEAAGFTGGLIGAYTFLDGQGVRHAGHPASYIAWSFLLDAIPMVIAVAWLRGRATIAWLGTAEARWAALGGAVGMAGYAIVMWAMSRGAMAQVSALRETGVVFAALIGTRLLREPFGRARVLASCGVLLGVLMLQLG